MAVVKRSSTALIDDSRYRYDEKICACSKGWAQFDTRQDAPYYGNWVNPVTLELFSYCEGDLTHTQCEDEADFIETLNKCIEWHRERGYFIGIDPGWPHTSICDKIRSAFVVLGFRDVLH